MNKKNIILIFMIVAGIIVGAMLSGFFKEIPFLSWLAYGQTIGISAHNPAVIDLSVLKLAFGFEIGINVSQIICIFAAIIIHKKIIVKKI